MLKTLAILAISAVMAIGVPGQPNKAASSKQGNAAQGQPAVVQPVSQDKQPDSEHNQAKAGKDSPGGNTALERPEVWWTDSNWWLVIIAGLTGIAIGWQAWLLRRTLNEVHTQVGHMENQTQILRDSVAAARKATDAAEISAKAAMGVAVPTLAVYRFSFDNEGRENPVAFYRCPKVRLKLRNYGQSPAFLRKYAIGFSWGDDSPQKFTWYPFEDQVIDAEGVYEFNERDMDVMDSPLEEAIADLVSGKRHLVFSGWVSYGDVFGSKPKRFTLSRELIDYDPDARKMSVLDTSGLTLWTDPTED